MKQKKNILFLLSGMVLGMMLLGTGAAAGIVATPTWQPIFVDGQQVEMEAYNIGGHNYVKLRDIGQQVGFNVFWDNGVQVDSDAPYTGVKPDSNLSAPSVAEPQTPESSSTDNIEIRQQMIELVNQIRAEHGASALTVNQSLMNAAPECSTMMTTSHQNRVECEAVLSHGYPHGFGSNLTLFTGVPSFRIAEKAVANWANSPGHLATMIDPGCDSVGVGFTVDGNKTCCYLFVGKPGTHNPYE